MRFLPIAFAVIAVVRAASLPADYLPPVEDNSLPVQEYLTQAIEAAEGQTVLADDGYRYKAVHSLKLRHRRDVNELPENEYVPPAEVEPAAEEKTVLADDGYRYKTVRRLKYRIRRDVNELPQNEYLPPAESAQETVVTKVVEAAAEPAAEQATVVGADGYRYKTVRRLRYRKRRDVNELPQNEYLPPAAEAPEIVLPEAQGTTVKEAVELVVPTAEQGTEVGADGYRYKTVRRLKYRKRRDVNELPQNRYLPPTEDAQETIVTKVVDAAAESAAEQGTEVGADGYRYKTVRRLRYRKRRDVNELPQNEYLPPAEDAQETIVTKVVDAAAESAAEQGTEVGADGYRYKTVRRLRYRKRRDVSELPQNEYLPPAEEAQETILPEAQATAVEYLPPAGEAQEIAVEEVPEPAPEEGTEVGADGYRYKTVRRLKYRKRRDVNELPQNVYLPPAEDVEEAILPEAQGTALEYLPPTKEATQESAVTEVAQPALEIALPANEYLPPNEEAQEVPEQRTIDETAVLADDGYRYKVVRRLKYRRH